jgi:hypothetical protein
MNQSINLRFADRYGGTTFIFFANERKRLSTRARRSKCFPIRLLAAAYNILLPCAVFLPPPPDFRKGNQLHYCPTTYRQVMST